MSTNETVKESSIEKKEKKISFFFSNYSSSIRSETTDIIVTRPTRSKLEHYGFNQLPRPTSIRNNKRQTLIKENKTKKIRSNQITPNSYVDFIHKKTKKKKDTPSIIYFNIEINLLVIQCKHDHNHHRLVLFKEKKK